jgi:hypothetical protein
VQKNSKEKSVRIKTLTSARQEKQKESQSEQVAGETLCEPAPFQPWKKATEAVSFDAQEAGDRDGDMEFAVQQIGLYGLTGSRALPGTRKARSARFLIPD